MSMPVTPETIDKIVNGGESLAKLMAGSGSQLVSETINLFIIDAALSVLKFSVVFIVFYIVKRYCDAMYADSDADTKKVFKALKTTALVLSLVFFTTSSFPHLQLIAKTLVAPHVFLAEKTAELVKK